MIFAEMESAKAEGAILAHSLRVGAATFKKGRVLTAGDIEALEQAGIARVTAARLEAGDVPEDQAAAELAQALAGPGLRVGEPFTGRCNLFAEADGVLAYERERIDAINLLDEALTAATLAPFETVAARQMVGTVKVIPFAAPRAALDKAVSLARSGEPILTLHPFRPHNAALVATRLPTTKESVLDKTHDVLAARLAAMGSRIGKEYRCAHEEAAVAGAVAEALAEGFSPVLVYGASAITDRRDVLPAGIARAGGEILHFGMPVDPGNLMLLARHGTTPVLGLPGCARSPKLNGFDFVLSRLLAGISVTREDVMRLGAGGLLKEIASRPQPRDGSGSAAATKPSAPRVAALVLAAGRSSRMGAANKLTAEIDGKPMLARVVDAALASVASSVTVVTGHEDNEVRAALAGRAVNFVHNPDYAEGLSTSLRAGVSALPGDIDAAVICLGDMPDISARHIDRLVAAYDPDEGRTICVPTFAGKRGNPVLWGARYLPEMQDLKGDVGAKHLIGEHEDAVCEVPMPDAATLTDIDTPEEMAQRRGK
ncbi:MAG TPA: molybdopterin-binding/glycosyltransferase family 2 protein [Parvibaculum sp.]|uniref:molybdopterin-binding/glycosyltransferase family 2 protein n=1 Tax=Parvibaculum sp. TaxID=2024848 RepID=UPI002CD0AC5C|nr:molybdopterin-binding/glycosyltransferase family 2 protein [Parvibaculum sp.]HMM13485.1 molybdopterin-binding/glycosyltransferase family 2 protein [Parvibaculum sp.]